MAEINGVLMVWAFILGYITCMIMDWYDKRHERKTPKAPKMKLVAGDRTALHRARGVVFKRLGDGKYRMLKNRYGMIWEDCTQADVDYFADKGLDVLIL